MMHVIPFSLSTGEQCTDPLSLEPIMKSEEELGHDRGFEFETDDEENQAQRHYSSSSSSSVRSYDDNNNGSGFYGHNNGAGNNSYQVTWPQSYRQSIDMMSSVVSPSVGTLLKDLNGSSLIEVGSSFLRPFTSVSEHAPNFSTHSHTQPLIPPHLPPPYASVLNDYAPTTPVFPASKIPSFAKSLPPSPQCSTTQAIINGVNVLCGVGLLTTPYALKEGGWLGMSLLFVFGIISCYTGVLLKNCLDSAPGLQTYPDIGQAAFGMSGRLFVSIVLYLELYACCVEYITLVGDSLSAIFPDAHMNFGGINLNAHQLFALTTAIAVLPTVWLRDLSLLSYLSAGGVVASILVVICLFWVGVVDNVGFRPGGTALDLGNLPVALGLYGFCYSGHSVFPNIYSSMKTRSQFPTVLCFCFLSCTILYAGVAAAGFLMFGESTKSQFTLNMPSEYLASKFAIWTTVVNPLSKYALTMTPVALCLEELLPTRKQSHVIVVMIRTALVFSTLIVALAVPFFGFVMALLGSIFTMLVALILPCACYLSIQRESISLLQVVLCILVIIVGVACSCIGSYSSIKQIADNFG